jgi:hypothetical protein
MMKPEKSLRIGGVCYAIMVRRKKTVWPALASIAKPARNLGW